MVRSLDSSIASMRAVNAFNNASRVASSQLARLSSGSRVPNARDDAAALSISRGISLEISALKSARNNLLQATSMLQMADGALGSIADVLNRMESIATLARNATLSPQESQALDLEYQQLVQSVDTIVDTTEFNGRSLLGSQPDFRMGIIGADVGNDDGFAGYRVEPGHPTHQDGDVFEISYDSTSQNMTLHHVREDVYQTVRVPTILAGDIESLDFDKLGISIRLTGDFDTALDIDPAVQDSNIVLATNAIGAVAPFVPSDLPNLVFHVSAEDSPLTTTGSGVSNAGDLEPVTGGNNAFRQTSPASQPDVASDSLFGKDAFTFNGTEFFTVNDNGAINTGTHAQKTIAMSFATGGDVGSRQLLWEEGATVNGMNMYIDSGRVYYGIYRSSGGVGTWLSAPINPNTEYTVSATFDSATNSTALYLNGAQVATGAGIGSTFPSHSGDIGVGRTNDQTIYHDGVSGNDTDFFTGSIGEVIYYNDAFNAAEHGQLDGYMRSVAFTELLFNSDEIDIQAASGADTVDRIALEIPKMSEQVHLLSETNVLSASAANAAHQQIQLTMDAVNAARADLGSSMNRFAFAEGIVSISLENQSQAESVLSDANIAEEMTAFMSQNLLLETASEMILRSQESGEYIVSLLDNSLSNG